MVFGVLAASLIFNKENMRISRRVSAELKSHLSSRVHAAKPPFHVAVVCWMLGYTFFILKHVENVVRLVITHPSR